MKARKGNEVSTGPRSASVPKSPRRRASLADRFCGAIKELTAERQTRTYAAQWIMVHSVARHLGMSDERAQEAIQAAGHRLKRAGDPPHSVILTMDGVKNRAALCRQRSSAMNR